MALPGAKWTINKRHRQHSFLSIIFEFLHLQEANKLTKMAQNQFLLQRSPLKPVRVIIWKTYSPLTFSVVPFHLSVEDSWPKVTLGQHLGGMIYIMYTRSHYILKLRYYMWHPDNFSFMFSVFFSDTYYFDVCMCQLNSRLNYTIHTWMGYSNYLILIFLPLQSCMENYVKIIQLTEESQHKLRRKDPHQKLVLQNHHSKAELMCTLEYQRAIDMMIHAMSTSILTWASKSVRPLGSVPPEQHLTYPRPNK